MADASVREERHTTTPFATLLASELSTGALRVELVKLFARENLPTAFLESYNRWTTLLAGIFDEIRGKPIKYPAGDPSTWRPAVRHAYMNALNMSLKAYGDDRAFICAFVVQVIHVPDRHPDPSQGTLHCLCITPNNLTIRTEIHAQMFESRPLCQDSWRMIV